MLEKPIITIKEARKILGQMAKSYSDEDILAYIKSFDEIAKLVIVDEKVLKTTNSPT